MAAVLQPELFRITASDYGVTGDIYKCQECGFLFCPTVGRVLGQYVQMSDTCYEETRHQRALQARKILEVIRAFKSGGALLDIGAGSGILVEQALNISYAAIGIEPSIALSCTAQQLGLPVRTGTLPQPDFRARFDIVTLIDVIEHVESPLALILEASAAMKSDAICVIVTPDVSSIVARLMRGKWWHYRAAHIGYFSQMTLGRLLNRAGFDIVTTRRPGWYFPASYLAERVMQYLPAGLRVKLPAVLDRVTVPLNLFDSLLIVARKRQVR
jgi:2-polyprenyl-3-methyl-5-hydroxy-6-metoxy-1,4-benzoquinol methylase